MHTTVAFAESQDPGAVFVNIAGVPDQHVRVDGDSIYVPDFNHLIGALACIGDNADTEVRLVAPSLRETNPFYVSPVELDLHPGAHVHHAVSRSVDIALEPMEQLQCEENSDPAAAEQHAVAVFLTPGQINPVAGRIITINFEITVAQTAGTWAYSAIDFVDELPIGNFDVVGARIVADGAVCARFVPVGGSYRPGFPCVASVEESGMELFRRGNLGTWFTFNTNNPPGVELLGSAAAGSATYQGYMDIIKR